MPSHIPAKEIRNDANPMALEQSQKQFIPCQADLAGNVRQKPEGRTSGSFQQVAGVPA
jgi:hypothetical protein